MGKVRLEIVVECHHGKEPVIKAPELVKGYLFEGPEGSMFKDFLDLKKAELKPGQWFKIYWTWYENLTKRWIENLIGDIQIEVSERPALDMVLSSVVKALQETRPTGRCPGDMAFPPSHQLP
jgi:hypothetical protein